MSNSGAYFNTNAVNCRMVHFNASLHKRAKNKNLTANVDPSTKARYEPAKKIGEPSNPTNNSLGQTDNPKFGSAATRTWRRPPGEWRFSNFFGVANAPRQITSSTRLNFYFQAPCLPSSLPNLGNSRHSGSTNAPKRKMISGKKYRHLNTEGVDMGKASGSFQLSHPIVFQFLRHNLFLPSAENCQILSLCSYLRAIRFNS